MKIPVSVIAALSILFQACAGADENKVSLPISFGAAQAQSATALAGHWQKLDDARRREIESFLFVRLGLSSTGSIRLIGVYRDSVGKDGGDERLFHFQQIDLMGARLIWSALVDPDAATARVLYHVDAGLVTGEPVPLDRR